MTQSKEFERRERAIELALRYYDDQFQIPTQEQVVETAEKFLKFLNPPTSPGLRDNP